MGGPKPDINLTPMIDITLVILIILMVAIPVELGLVDVDVPSPDPPKPPPKPDEQQLVVALYADGSVALNREAMPAEELGDALTRHLRNRSDARVYVDADQDVAFGALVEVVDLAREAGGEVGLPRLKPDGPLPPRSQD